MRRLTKLRKILEHVTNNETDKAEELVHDYFVETARTIFQKKLEEDEGSEPSFSLDENVPGNVSESDEFFGDEAPVNDPWEQDDFSRFQESDEFNLDTSDPSGDIEQDLENAEDISSLRDEIETEEHFTESASIYEEGHEEEGDPAGNGENGELSFNIDDDAKPAGDDDEFSSFNDEGEDSLGGDDEGFQEMLPADDEEAVTSEVDGTKVEKALDGVESALDDLRAMFSEIMTGGDDEEAAEASELDSEMDGSAVDTEMGDDESAGVDLDMPKEGEAPALDDENLPDDEMAIETAKLKKLANVSMPNDELSNKSPIRDKLPDMRQLIDVASYPAQSNTEKETKGESPKDFGVKGPQDQGAKLQNAKKPSMKGEKPTGKSPIGGK